MRTGYVMKRCKGRCSVKGYKDDPTESKAAVWIEMMGTFLSAVISSVSGYSLKKNEYSCRPN